MGQEVFIFRGCLPYQATLWVDLEAVSRLIQQALSEERVWVLDHEELRFTFTKLDPKKFPMAEYCTPPLWAKLFWKWLLHEVFAPLAQRHGWVLKIRFPLWSTTAEFWVSRTGVEKRYCLEEA